jgi:hypothetical protein
MSVALLLAELKTAGVALSLTPHGTLHYKAAPGAMTPALLQRLKAEKGEILALLREQAAWAVSPSPLTGPDPGPVPPPVASVPPTAPAEPLTLAYPCTICGAARWDDAGMPRCNVCEPFPLTETARALNAQQQPVYATAPKAKAGTKAQEACVPDVAAKPVAGCVPPPGTLLIDAHPELPNLCMRCGQGCAGYPCPGCAFGPTGRKHLARMLGTTHPRLVAQPWPQMAALAPVEREPGEEG